MAATAAITSLRKESLRLSASTVVGASAAVNAPFDERRRSVAADARIDVFGMVDDRRADVALPDRSPGHFEHALQGHTRAFHHFGRQLDPGLEVAQAYVEL